MPSDKLRRFPAEECQNETPAPTKEETEEYTKDMCKKLGEMCEVVKVYPAKCNCRPIIYTGKNGLETNEICKDRLK